MLIMYLTMTLACVDPSPPVPPAHTEVAEVETPDPRETDLAIEVLHRGAWTDAFVNMVGVDTPGGRALIETSSTQGGRFGFEVVDYVEGVREERWEASPEFAPSWTPSGNQFGPISSTLEADLARLGALVVSMDSPHLSGWPPVAASFDGAHFAYTADDKLWLTDSKGTRLRRLSTGQIAGYYPVFSLDGGRIAWIGTARGQGYGLYVASLEGKARRVEATDSAAIRPYWAPDGSHVYIQDTQIQVREHGRVCLSIVPLDEAAQPGEIQKAGCLQDVTSAHVFFDPSGSTAVLAGRLAGPEDEIPSEGTTRYRLIALPSGEVLATHDEVAGGLLPLLTADGRILTGAAGSTWFIDLRTGDRAEVEDMGRLSTGVFSGHEADGDLILLRSYLDRPEAAWAWEIVRLNPDVLLPRPER